MIPNPATIGLIGVGLLGTALAQRLASAGFSVIGFDPDSEAMKRLSQIGGTPVTGPEEVASRCRRLLLSLPAPPQVAETVGKIESVLKPESIVLDTTTGDPEAVEASADRFARMGIDYMDCEVGGSSRQTAAGEAILMCGGPQEAFDRCSDIFASISRSVFHTGIAGTGTRMKLTLNIAIGLHRAVLAESLAFAQANGIDGAAALEILKAGPAYSKAMDVKGKKMLDGDFVPEARLAQHLKDVRLILQTGESVGARLPLSALHRQLLEEAVDAGWAAEDNSAILKVFTTARGAR